MTARDIRQETDPPRRGSAWKWSVLAFALILFGYPLALAFASPRARVDFFPWVYGALALIALLAAAWAIRRTTRPRSPAP